MAPYSIGAPTARAGVLEARADVAATVRDGISNGSNVALWGLGGSGKSALAAALVRDPAIRAASSDGWLWLNVGNSGSSAPTWHLQLLDWARSMGVQQDRIANARGMGPAELLNCIQGELGESQVLLVFDDVWDEQEALLFKNVGHRCVRLLTSPYRSVASRFAPNRAIRVSDLSESGAETLFTNLAPTVIELRPDAARRCLAEVGLLPLVIVIVATYLEACAVDDPQNIDGAIGEIMDVRARYDVKVDLASGEFTTLPEGIPPTLRAVIDLSATSLAPPDRSALAALAAFPPKPNTFSWPAADGVTKSHESVVAARRIGLIEDADQEGRLTINRVVRDYVLQGGDAAPESYGLMAEFFVHHVDKVHADTNYEEWLQALRPEMANINAALSWLTTFPDSDAQLGLELMAALWDYWYRRGYYERASELAGSLLRRKVEDTTRRAVLLRAKVSNDAGNFAYNMADLDAAEELHVAAMKVRRELADDSTAGSLNNLGLVYRERGDYDTAMRLFREALEWNERPNNVNGLRVKWAGFNLNNLGITAARRGDVDAEEFLRRGVQTWASTPDSWGTAMARIDLGIFLAESGRSDDARSLLATSLREQWAHEEAKLSASALRGLAILALDAQEFAHARELVAGAMNLSASIRDRLGEWASLAVLSQIGRHTMAFDEVARTVGILDVFGAYSGMVLAPRYRIEVQQAQQDARQALGTEYEAAVASGRAGVPASGGRLDLEAAVAAVAGPVDLAALIARVAPKSLAGQP